MFPAPLGALFLMFFFLLVLVLSKFYWFSLPVGSFGELPSERVEKGVIPPIKW